MFACSPPIQIGFLSGVALQDSLNGTRLFHEMRLFASMVGEISDENTTCTWIYLDL